MKESTVILLVETIFSDGYKIETIQRDSSQRCSGYLATIVVIAKSIPIQLMFDLQNKLHDDGITDIEVIGTQRDLREMDFEILKVEAQIEEA